MKLLKRSFRDFVCEAFEGSVWSFGVCGLKVLLLLLVREPAFVTVNYVEGLTPQEIREIANILKNKANEVESLFATGKNFSLRVVLS